MSGGCDVWAARARLRPRPCDILWTLRRMGPVARAVHSSADLVPRTLWRDAADLALCISAAHSPRHATDGVCLSCRWWGNLGGGPFTAARDGWRMPGVSVVGQSRRRIVGASAAWSVERGSWCGEGDDVEQGGRALMCTASRVWVTRTLLRSGWQWGGCECHGQDPTVTGCSMGSFHVVSA